MECGPIVLSVPAGSQVLRAHLILVLAIMPRLPPQALQVPLQSVEKPLGWLSAGHLGTLGHPYSSCSQVVALQEFGRGGCASRIVLQLCLHSKRAALTSRVCYLGVADGDYEFLGRVRA